MELLRKTGTIKDTEGRSISHGDFKCGICEKIVNKSLTHGNRQLSCGCRPSAYKHGLRKKRVYKIWKKMKERCYNKNEIGFKYWGGRGIIVCSEWKNDPKAFVDWAMQNGYADDLTIDRIDNNGNYEPSNCRFITLEDNIRNRGWNKLSLEKAAEIRQMYSTGHHSQRKLAKLFNTSQVNIWSTIHNKIWA